MFSAEVLKCLPIYKFAPRAFKDEKKKKQSHGAHTQEKENKMVTEARWARN